MNPFPFENITYNTKLSEADVVKRLRNVLMSRKELGFLNSGRDPLKSYTGEMDGSDFKIKRIMYYRNSFRPVITGKIQQDLEGTTVKVKMRLTIFSIVFLIFWCAIIGSMSLGPLVAFLTGKSVSSFELIPLGMLVFAYVLTMVGFKFESRKSKSDLQKIFEAEMIG